MKKLKLKKFKSIKLNKKNVIILSILGVLLLGGITIGVVSLMAKDENNESYTNYKKDEDKKEEENISEPKVQVVDLDSKSRPFAVMINNLGVARPFHTGLQEAYLVYEIVVEGGITRYLALFKDKDLDTVGSVRSSRHYFLDYALENDAYYIHWGWSPQARSDISKLKVNNINGLTYGKPYFFRQKLGISSEHTGFVNLNEMKRLVEKNYRTETNKDLLLNYSVESLDLSKMDNVSEALKIDLKYSNSFVTNYIYDSEAKVYKQAVNNKEHNDYESKKQYTVKNIITYQVSNSTIDGKGRQNIDNIGSGKGYYITEGVSVPITWEKKSRSDQTIYKYLNGDEITVNDGNTWIHIVPTSGNVSIS